MSDTRLVARVEEDRGPEQGLLVRSPAVGVLDRVPARGAYLDASQRTLTLRILGRRHAVALPVKVQGWVTERLIDETSTPVEYDQPLFRLSRAQAPEAGQAAGGVPGSVGAEGLEEGLAAVRSPSQGVFYRRPDPQRPPYVEEGSRVEVGTVLGMVEIMKCFHRIAYGGAGLPERGTISRILVDDAAEVEFDQPLFLVRSDG
jgi:acetyl-CoA carboxylase biotin carboxyl carrier protein